VVLESGWFGALDKPPSYACVMQNKNPLNLINNSRLMHKGKVNLNLWHIIYMLSTARGGKGNP